MTRLFHFLFAAVCLWHATLIAAADARLALIGDWALTLPSQEAGWLSVRDEGGKVAAELLWAVGSAKAVADLEVKDGTLSFTRSIKRPLSPRDEPAVLNRVTATADGDVLRCTMRSVSGGDEVQFIGKRMPPLPTRPDLTKVSFGEATTLFNGRDLSGWHPSNPAKKNGWSARDGLLSNDTPKTDFGAYGEYANLRTDADFTDFQLHAEYRLPPEIGGNSGVYLRGLYEVQVTHRDSQMQGINGPGAVFGRIAPTKNAGKPAGEWEALDVTLVDRHVTVVLNGEKVIDNEPVAGPTGGALHSDVTAPGPIYLQGDHTSVQYRNITLRPKGADAAQSAASVLPAPVFKTAPGFAVERVFTVPRDLAGSWVALAPDRRGGLIASDQYGGLFRLKLAAGTNAKTEATRLPVNIGGVHGLAWVGDALYAVAAQKAAHPPGLYRLRDTDGDGDLDSAELLREFAGDGEHGPHAVLPAPDGRSLYVLGANGCKMPALARSRVPALWGDDSLLPDLPYKSTEPRANLSGGWLCRTDLDGREWELIATGLRNSFAFALDRDGEIFTYDADNERDLNLPWYRPTRVLHVVSGADFGWRIGACKIPERNVDGWPAVLDMGLGSPTAVLIPRAARLPEKYRRALWVGDWSYGRIFALHLHPQGASVVAERELIASAAPLPVTAMCVNPDDGALYFATGGRRIQSAIYRLSWKGDDESKSDSAVIIPPAAALPAVAQRQALEKFHGHTDPQAVKAAWPLLASADEVLRRTARTAVESQPVDAWRRQALDERDPRTALTALAALARADGKAAQPEILDALLRLHRDTLPRASRLEWLETLRLVIARGDALADDKRIAWLAVLEALPRQEPADAETVLVELLVHLRSSRAMERALDVMRDSSTSRETQLALARCMATLLARADATSPAQRAEYAAWLERTASWRGGGNFNLFTQWLRDDAARLFPPEERASFEKRLAAAAKSASTPAFALSMEGRAPHEWTTDELAAAATTDAAQRDVNRGRALFTLVGCVACHAHSGQGGTIGPDLTSLAGRFATRDIIEAIVEPSREISDQYGTVQIKLRDGRTLSGRIVNHKEDGISLSENLYDPSAETFVAEKDIAAIETSMVSLMPAGLINLLRRDEILDLLAFLRSGAAPE